MTRTVWRFGIAAATRRSFVWLPLVVLLLAAGGAWAAEVDENWVPAPPTTMPASWDWIQMSSEEWLKGEFIAMYDDNLEFDSDEFDMQNLDWDDIQRVRTSRTMRVGFLGDTVAIGKLHIDGDVVTVITAEGEQKFERSQVLTIAAGEPKEINFWSGKVSFGFNIRRGNSDTLEYNTSARFQRRTVKNRLNVDYLGNFNETESVEVANNHRASFGWDRFLSDRLFVNPVFAEYFRDPFQNIGHRETVGVGMGYQLVDTPKLDWEVSGGPAYQRTTYFSVEPDTPESEDTPALVVGTVLDWELNNRVDLLWEYRFQVTNDETGRYNHHFVLGFETELTSMLDFDIQWVWDRIEKPRPGEDSITPLQDDFRMVVALSFDW